MLMDLQVVMRYGVKMFVLMVQIVQIVLVLTGLMILLWTLVNQYLNLL